MFHTSCSMTAIFRLPSKYQSVSKVHQYHSYKWTSSLTSEPLRLLIKRITNPDLVCIILLQVLIIELTVDEGTDNGKIKTNKLDPDRGNLHINTLQ